jgi:hypothetical protein
MLPATTLMILVNYQGVKLLRVETGDDTDDENEGDRMVTTFVIKVDPSHSTPTNDYTEAFV